MITDKKIKCIPVLLIGLGGESKEEPLWDGGYLNNEVNKNEVNIC